MRYTRAGLAAVGLALAAGAVSWRLATPARTAELPAGLDRTTVSGGSYTLYASPNGMPKPVPDRRTLTQVSRLTVGRGGTTTTLRTTLHTTLGGATLPDVVDSSLVDRRTHALVGSGEYAAALPPDTGDGPYRLHVDDLAQPLTLRRDGPAVVAGGLTLVPLRAQVRRAALAPAFSAGLGAQGLSGLSLRTLSARLVAGGFDPRAFGRQVYPYLSAADRAVVGPYLTRGLPVRLTADVDVRLLVEPRTGLIVAVDHEDGTLYARPDLRVVDGLLAILERPAYARFPRVVAAARGLARAVAAPPTITLAAAYQAQTPASVAETAGYAAAQRARLGRPSPAGPTALGGAGVVLVLGALGWALLGPPAAGAARHRRGDRTACVEWAQPVERHSLAAADREQRPLAGTERHRVAAAPAERPPHTATPPPAHAGRRTPAAAPAEPPAPASPERRPSTAVPSPSTGPASTPAAAADLPGLQPAPPATAARPTTAARPGSTPPPAPATAARRTDRPAGAPPTDGRPRARATRTTNPGGRPTARAAGRQAAPPEVPPPREPFERTRRRSWTVSRPNRPFRRNDDRLAEQYRHLLPPATRD